MIRRTLTLLLGVLLVAIGAFLVLERITFGLLGGAVIVSAALLLVYLAVS